MKTEILQILQMHREGRLSDEQTAELLSVLADQAREKESASPPSHTIGTFEAGAEHGSRGAPGPQAGGGEKASSDQPCGNWSAASALHDFVDAAVGFGTTVGRVATVWGGEVAQMVHREQSGNTITMSKVCQPGGTAFTFSGNTINISKLHDLTLNDAEFANNTLNASRVAHLLLARARFSQCQISGSSLHDVTLEGTQAVEGSAPSTPGAIRGSTFNATKFARARLLAGSQMDACSFQASAIKDLELSEGAALRDSRVVDSSLASLALQKSTLKSAVFERSHIHALSIQNATLEQVAIGSSRITDTTIAGGTWTSVRFRRDVLSLGSGGKNSLLQESRFENCTLTNCDFTGCTFRRTTLRNLTLSGITVRNVDFTGLILDSEEAFRKAAGL